MGNAGKNRQQQAIYQPENHRYDIEDIDSDRQEMEAKIQYLERKLATIQDNQISSSRKNNPVITRPKTETYRNSLPNTPQTHQNTQSSPQYYYQQNSSVQRTNPSKVPTSREGLPSLTPNTQSSVEPQPNRAIKLHPIIN